MSRRERRDGGEGVERGLRKGAERGERYTVKNGVFQNSCLGCLNVHSSTTPNRVFLKPLFEGVTGHPQNTLTIGSESLKGV